MDNSGDALSSFYSSSNAALESLVKSSHSPSSHHPMVNIDDDFDFRLDTTNTTSNHHQEDSDDYNEPGSPSATSAAIQIPGSNNWASILDYYPNTSPNHPGSPALPYTPSYQGSFNSLGSNPDSVHSWGGRADHPSSSSSGNLGLNLGNNTDTNMHNFGIDEYDNYDPSRFDNPSDGNTYDLLFQTQSKPDITVNEHTFSQSYSTPFDPRSSPSYNPMSSPGSSPGHGDQDENSGGSRSRGSSVSASSYHNNIGESPLFNATSQFDNLGLYGNSPSQAPPPLISLQQMSPSPPPSSDSHFPPGSPSSKQSPPPLLIPEDTTSLFPRGGGNGGGNGMLGVAPPGPSINIVPSTPVSGGAGASGDVAHSFNERDLRKSIFAQNSHHLTGTGSPAQPPRLPSTATSGSAVSDHHVDGRWASPFPGSGAAPHGFSSSSAFGAGAGGLGLAQPSLPYSSSFGPPASIPTSATSSALPANLDYLNLPITNRNRSKSDTSLNPFQLPQLPQLPDNMFTLAPMPHQSTVNPSSLSPYMSSMGMYQAPSSTSSINPLRRTISNPTKHQRGSKSEDFRRVPPSSGTQDEFIRSITSSDGTLVPPNTNRQRPSGGSHSRTSSLGSGSGSPRVSPYQKPSSLPKATSDDGTVVIERMQVTTPATSAASASRRTSEANFVCPIPGCGSTFTRQFNLKGHLRSHAEERPFKCQWAGCSKAFARQHDCKRHQALHLNIRPFTCEGCERTFARQDALNRHLRSEGGTDCRIYYPNELAASGGNTSPGSPKKLGNGNGGWAGSTGAGGGILM